VTITNDDVIEVLRPVEDPELHRSIVDLGMVRRVDIALPSVTVAIDLTIAGCPLRAEINNRVSDAVRALDGVEEVGIEFGVMTDEQRETLRRNLHGDPGATAGSNQAHGHAELGEQDDPMTNATKYVATSNPDGLTWQNSIALTGDIATEVARLKDQDGPLLQVHGSWALIQTLLDADLVDEYRLWTFPVVVGEGKRLFPDHGPRAELTLRKSAASGNSGAVMSIYRRSRP